MRWNAHQTTASIYKDGVVSKEHRVGIFLPAGQRNSNRSGSGSAASTLSLALATGASCDRSLRSCGSVSR
jgi:hypothetical protein